MNILVITYWKFDDALIQTYTLPYLRIMRSLIPAESEITLITLEPKGEIKKEIPVEPGIVRFSFRLHPFGLSAILSWYFNLRKLRSIIRKKKISTIHTWCTPAGGIGNILSRQTGVPLVLDSFEPHAEAMVETGTWHEGKMAFRTLFKMERQQLRRARWIIAVVEGMKKYAQEKYGYTGTNYLVKPACIDFEQFNLSKRKNAALLTQLNLTDKIVCVYAGKFGGLYMTDETYRFFRMAHEVFGSALRVLILSPAPKQEIIDSCIKNGVDTSIIITEFVPHEQVANYMGLGDFAFSAIKPVPSKRYCTPIKNGEYWAMGLPVVIADNISDDSDIIRANNAGYVLESHTDEELRKAAEHVRQLLMSEDRTKLAERIHQLAQKHRNFGIAEKVYRTIYCNQ